jgi:hypothetical protein
VLPRQRYIEFLKIPKLGKGYIGFAKLSIWVKTNDKTFALFIR